MTTVKNSTVIFRKKNALYLSVTVFSPKVLIGTLHFTSPSGDGTARWVENEVLRPKTQKRRHRENPLVNM